MSARPAPEDTAEPQLAAGAAAESQPTVDAQHPWLGLASFTEETRGYFHGREEEVAELARRVQRKLLTVLFGQSGLGKTSILRAGIVPRLRPEGYCPVYVRVDYSPESPPPSEQIKQAIFRATEASGQWTKPGVSSEGESLWEFLHHRDDLLLDAGGQPVIPLLIFDQFEEIFTLAQADDAGRQRAAQFVDDLADLVENRLPKALEAKLDQDDSITERFDFGRADYRILIALREDYLAHLESVKGVMPSITQNRMRLARMNGQQALAAVLKPGGRLVSQEVAESIVRFIAGGSELRNAEVEPSLLSLICRELNNTRIAQGRAEISADLLAGSHDTILAEFYERALADQPAAVRKVIEDQLLTESGFRESLAEERLLKAFADAGAAPDALATLVNRRLLRIEERLDVRRVELTHDVLCGVVKASRQLRMEREALEEAERRLAEQRSREAATRKALVRARQIAAGCAVLAVVAVVGAIFGYVNMQRARQAEASALDSRRLAEGARGEAEKLVVFLLEDFQLELEPIGRLDIVASLSKRALDYYAGLPAELRTPATERNRALAEVRYAISLRNLGRLDEALQAAGSAEDTLRRLRDGGDASEPTLIGLAMATHARARALSQKGVFADSRRASTQAHDMLRPVVEAHGASVAVRRAFGEVSIQHGFNVLRASDFEQAVPIFEQARTALRSIDGLKLADLSSAALFVEVTAWQMDALMPLGRIDEARRIAEEARPVADGVIEKQPGHMMALRARALLMSNFADLSNHQLRLHAALPYYAAVARDYEALLKVDPGNLIAWNNLGGTLLSLGLLTEASGRPREGLRHLRAAAATGRQGGMTSVRAGNIADMWFHVARVEADLGNPEAARAALAEAARYIDIVVREAPAGSFRRLMYEPWMPVAEAQVLLNLNDFPGARAKGEAAAKQLETVRPQSDSERAFLGVQLSDAWWAAAQSAYLTRDYAIAEPAARRAVEVRTSTPAQNKFEEVWRAEYRALHAMALAKLGRIAEARTALEPAVRYHASLPALDEAEWVRVRRAPVRLAQALVTPAQAQALLGEAAQLLENLPPELRATNSIIQLRNEIAIEQGRRR